MFSSNVNNVICCSPRYKCCLLVSWCISLSSSCLLYLLLHGKSYWQQPNCSVISPLFLCSYCDVIFSIAGDVITFQASLQIVVSIFSQHLQWVFLFKCIPYLYIFISSSILPDFFLRCCHSLLFLLSPLLLAVWTCQFNFYNYNLEIIS